jgi:hypothetical protein
MSEDKFSFFKSWTDGAGISHVEYMENTDIDMMRAIEIVQHGKQKFPGSRLYILNDLTNLRSVTNDALEYICTTPVTQFKGAEAFVINDLSNRILVNYYLRKNPQVITEKFTSKDEAYKWLLEQKRLAGD